MSRRKLFESTDRMYPPSLREKLVNKFPTLDVKVEQVKSAPNQLKEVVVVRRVVKRYDEVAGCLQSVELVICNDLSYTVHIFQEKFLSGVVSKADFVTLPILLKIANEDKWFVCLGVPDYSSYKQYHVQDSVTDLLLPDTKRHKDCP